MKIKPGSSERQRLSMSRVIWGFAIFGIVVLILIWSGLGTFSSGGKSITPTTGIKVLFTIALLFVLLIGFFLYRYQQRKDSLLETGKPISSKTNKVIETGLKVSGYYSKIKAIGGIIGTILALCVSIYFLFKGFTTPQGTAYFIFSLIMLIIAIGAGINSYIYWKRSKPLFQSRYY